MASNLRLKALFEVKDRWVAITGAGEVPSKEKNWLNIDILLSGSGIGRILARGCTVNGANTILIDVNERSLEETKTELQELSRSEDLSPTSVVTIHGDLSSEAGVTAVVAAIKSIRGSLDALIHCAAVRYMNEVTYKPGGSLGDLEDATMSAPYQGWEQTFRLNVLAPYYLTAGLVRPLGTAAAKGDGRGCVLMLSSPASVHNHQFVPCYQTSKAAVDHLVRIMAAEFADYYIRVNGISPGIVPSGMTTTDANSNLHLAAEAPAGRAGNEDDMVGTMLWLISKAGAFMDGKVFRVEGGRLLILRGATCHSG
ncbi:short-chain dehydrogenase [Aspergillus phoenicis ATCC 13157]|uniref:Short-chain dehydrogenase n=1 Tax=Aspergillus phoenicis ATCC 13157 TaxID=1353007 RepID=A0A370PBS8_ASPPH|nr:short-chain dehydrogenase [Aspergillus phoenicis ATCC 13157]